MEFWHSSQCKLPEHLLYWDIFWPMIKLDCWCGTVWWILISNWTCSGVFNNNWLTLTLEMCSIFLANLCISVICFCASLVTADSNVHSRSTVYYQNLLKLRINQTYKFSYLERDKEFIIFCVNVIQHPYSWPCCNAIVQILAD